MSTDQKCLTDRCDKPRQWKGLCRSCYGQARKLIDEDQTTWEELEAMGLVILDDRPFRQAFLKKKREAEPNQPSSEDATNASQES